MLQCNHMIMRPWLEKKTANNPLQMRRCEGRALTNGYCLVHQPRDMLQRLRERIARKNVELSKLLAEERELVEIAKNVDGPNHGCKAITTAIGADDGAD